MFSRLYLKRIVLHLAMTNWLIHRLLTAKRHISDIPSILCRMTKWKWLLRGGILLPIYMVMFWESGSYYWLYAWHGVIFLSQMAEKGYMFLLGLFLKIWGLKRLKLDNSLEIGSKIGIRIRMYRVGIQRPRKTPHHFVRYAGYCYLRMLISAASK